MSWLDMEGQKPISLDQINKQSNILIQHRVCQTKRNALFDITALSLAAYGRSHLAILPMGKSAYG